MDKTCGFYDRRGPSARTAKVKRNNLSAMAGIEQLRRRLSRLEDGFLIEKEEALFEGTRDALNAFREWCRTHLQPECGRLSAELSKIVAELVQGDEWHEEALSSAQSLRRSIEDSLSRFVGTPNRLLRNADVVERLSTDRSPPGTGRKPVRAEPDPGMRETDPPVPCPICGSILMTDRDFTILACPSCGVGESLDPGPPDETGGPEEDPGGPPEENGLPG